MDLAISLLTTALLAGGVLAFAGLGEVISERVGVVNLGLEGLVAIGAVTAIAATIAVPDAMFGLGAALGAGLVFGMLFAFATVVCKAGQVLCGLALTLLGTGLSGVVGRSFSGMPAPVSFEPVKIPLLSDLPVIGPALFSQNLLVYLAFIVLPLAVHFILFRTRHGLNMRAVGENPAAADAAGVSVTTIRFWYVCLGAMFATGAGAYLTLAFIPSWSEGMVAGRGWIAAALVIFAGYRPLRVVFCALLFGLITAVGYVGQANNWPIAAPILSMLPYLGTLALIIVPAVLLGRSMATAPEALGRPYHRDIR